MSAPKGIRIGRVTVNVSISEALATAAAFAQAVEAGADPVELLKKRFIEPGKRVTIAGLLRAVANRVEQDETEPKR